MIRTIIIDDEQHNIANLKALMTKHCASVEVVATASNAAEARTKLLQLKPDLVFLDIHMPGENGFDVLKSLGECSFEIIFATAFNEYGIMAIKFSALDYLLKPINVAELVAAVEKAEKAISAKKHNSRLENLLHLLEKSQADANERIALPTLKETFLIPVKDIVRCESSNNYTTFFLIDGTQHIISRPIYEYEELLDPYGFIRCHQSHLVNKHHIKSILNEDGGYLIMEKSEVRVPISKQRKNKIKAIFN